MTDIADAAARHRSTAELEAQAAWIRSSPADRGAVELIVRRPVPESRQILDVAELDLVDGVAGDCWKTKRTSAGHPPQPNKQLNLINARVSRVVAGDDDADRALAGDQLHVDLDLSPANLPPGTLIGIGDAVIEVTADPHTGCAKFRRRFGDEALQFVNRGEGAELRWRGIRARVVRPGQIRRGDLAIVLGAATDQLTSGDDARTALARGAATGAATGSAAVSS